MAEVDFKLRTEETTKWPWVIGSVVLAGAFAAWFAWPEEVGSFLKEAKEMVAGKSHKEQVASAQGSTMSSCNGLIVVNCKADHSVVQNKGSEKAPEAPVDVKAKTPPAQ